MRSSFFFSSIFAALVLFCQLARSGQSEDLTLMQALAEAQKNSPEVQKSYSRYQEMGWKHTGSYSSFLPTLSASANYLFSKKYVYFNIAFPGSPTASSIPEIIPSSAFTLTAQWGLFDGFSGVNNFRATSALERSAENDYQWNLFSIKRTTAVQFYRSLAAQTLREVAEQNLKTLQDHLKDITLYKKAGISTNYDVLRVEVQVSEARSELMSTVDNEVIAKEKLGEVLGIESETRTLKGQLPVLDADRVQNLKFADLGHRQDIQALSQRTEASRLQDLSASSYWIPKISLVGQYQYYNDISDGFSNWGDYQNAYTVGINLTWNLFDGLASYSHSRETYEQYYQADKSLTIAKLHAKIDFEMWKRKFIYFCSVYKSRVSDVEKTKESVRLAREGRRAGTRTNTDLLDAELEFFRSRAGVVNAQIGSIEALGSLELATGENLMKESELR